MTCYKFLRAIVLRTVWGFAAAAGLTFQTSSCLGAEEPKPIRALLVIGGCCHDYRAQKKILTEGISARANVEWTIVHEGDGVTTHRMSIYEKPEWWKGFDVVVHDECCADVKDKDFVEGILKPHREGLPAVTLHCAMHCYRVSFEEFKDWFEFTGLDSRGHGAQLPIALSFVNANHPITKGMQDWTTIQEELYNNVKIYDTATPLIYGQQGKDKNMVAWVNSFHGTRVFSTTLGHNNETVGDARYLDLVTRGLLWAVDKLNADYLKPAKHVMADEPGGGAKAQVRRPVNLALRKPAFASASQPGHNPSDAVDGNPDTRWCAPDNGNGYWWQVDLQTPQQLTGCRIMWEQEDKPYQYRVVGSADGQTWQTLVEETGSSRPAEDEHKFSASGIRYVRVTVTRAPAGSWASFWEMEVFGTQMALMDVNSQRDARLAEVKVPAGFEKTIFASPPNISYPTCIAADPSGQVFVGCDLNGSLDTQPNRGWVVRCADTNGDGVADQFKVFAKMDSPRGLVFDHNTLYVMHPPVLEAYYDDDGDGVADRSEVLVRGLAHDLSFRGADHTCNGVRMGIDGWLYIALGDYGATKAVAKDGSELQLHGGGIVRVRPDGTELELVSRGTRNIYDVAIDPEMNIFTCDNTNDGDDWNVRLSHMLQTGSYGYPSLFRHFSDEMMPTMMDYGGGSPTGSLYVDEPGFPSGYGDTLYTCQWGWNNVTRHVLTPDGATYKAGRETFIELPRPTGIDADGLGNIYVASWKGATFTYAGPNVGYVLKVTPAGHKAAEFPVLSKVNDQGLIKLLASPSAVQRFHVQREVLRRSNKAELVKGVEQLVLSHESAGVRVAAIYTLKQMLGAEANSTLLRVAKDETMRAFALRALADRKTEASGVATTVFTDALGDKDPIVRAQATIALNRLGRKEAAEKILPLTTEPDIAVSHLAFRALVSLDAAGECFKAIDRGSSALVPGAMRVLRNLHEAKVVEGLIERVDKTESVETRQLMLQALCRLGRREADWDGSWWGTRPDTSGPYFKAVAWEQSDKIAQALQQEIGKLDEASLRYLLEQIQLHKLELPACEGPLLQVASQKPGLRAAVAGLLAQYGTVSPPVVAFLKAISLDAQEESGLRLKAFEALTRASGQPEAAEAAVSVLVASSQSDAGAIAKRLREAFMRDVQQGRNSDYFEKLATSGSPAQKEVAFAVLLELSSNSNAPKRAKAAAKQTIDAAWKSGGVACLLRAVGDTHATPYAEEVRARLHDAQPEVAAAAAYASERLANGSAPMPAPERKNVIAKMAYEDVMHAATTAAGDPKLGAQLFQTVGCVKCHTTSKSEPLKGPFLGDIATRYRPPEIIESILRPNAQIAQGFVTTWVEMKDGSEFEGFIVRESGDELELRNLAGATVVAKKEIERRGTRTTSIMPEGLMDQMSPDDLASLVAYLQSLKGT